MNYYYDIILNWSEARAYEFYEWNDTDYLELFKKIPLFKIKHKCLLELISLEIKMDKEFLEQIKDKSMISGKNIIDKVMYAALFTDGKNVLALEFNSDGLVISRSKLLIDDELNVIESIYNLKDYNLNYTVLKPLSLDLTLRQEQEAKKLITIEIDNLYQKKDLSKLKYLYYECKHENIDDINVIHSNLLKELNNFNQNILKLYYIIKLSYHNV